LKRTRLPTKATAGWCGARSAGATLRWAITKERRAGGTPECRRRRSDSGPREVSGFTPAGALDRNRAGPNPEWVKLIASPAHDFGNVAAPVPPQPPGGRDDEQRKAAGHADWCGWSAAPIRSPPTAPCSASLPDPTAKRRRDEDRGANAAPLRIPCG
jgi:hypothetical protein